MDKILSAAEQIYQMAKEGVSDSTRLWRVIAEDRRRHTENFQEEVVERDPSWWL
ncbi:MAG: hypothetical protein ACR2RE_12980 [Geminicoccaceae bacterium]